PAKPIGQVLDFPCADSFFVLSANGKVAIAAPAENKYQRYLRLWDTTTGHQIGAPLAQPGGNEFWLFGPGGNVLWTIEADHSTHRWDASTRADLGPGPPFSLSVPIQCSELSPDGTTWLIGSPNGTALTWDLAAGAVRGRSPMLPGSVDAVAFSPEGKTILT